MTPPGALPTLYRFADLTLDVAQRRVWREDQPIELKTLDFDLLRFLAESAPNIVNAETLAEQVWGRHFVSPENVVQRVMLLRQSLDDDAARPRYIETVRNKGYRLIPEVQQAPADAPAARPRRPGLSFAAASTLVAVSGLVAAAGYWLSGPGEKAPLANSVAVLSFDNLSPDPDQAYFVLGIQDEIVSQLINLGSLRVVAVRPGEDRDRSISDIARAVNVETVLSGSVRYSEGQVRVTPRLTRGDTSETLWSYPYEREFSNIFDIQSDIALNVAQALSIELSAAERERVERTPTKDTTAYHLYLSASARQLRDTREEQLLAIDEVERALARDSEFAAAWVLDSNLRTVAQFYDPAHALEHREAGVRAARRALELDPNRGHAHAALAFALSLTRDWTGAEAAYRNARNLNVPLGDMPAYAILLMSVGHFAYAREILAEARETTPQNSTAMRFLMFASAGLGDWETATDLYESGRRLFEPWREGENHMMHLLIGLKEFARASTIPTADPINAAMLAHLDEPEAAIAELRGLYAQSPPGNPVRRRDIALWAGHYGDPALALNAMSAALAEQGGQAVYLWLPQLHGMRELPGFRTLLRDIGIVAYWRAFGWPSACQPLDAEEFECH